MITGIFPSSIFWPLLVIFTFICSVASGQKKSTSSYPQGSIGGPFEFESQIYPGTIRDYWIYVPAQYDAEKETCSMIVQDGLSRAEGWNLINVMDSLIEAKTIPVMLGIFIGHGRVPAADTSRYPRFNRSFEYDALGDRYARFLTEELLPEIKKSYNLSDDPNDRCIAGASSGAICAFNAAWERPDAFSRVLSTIGTYVGLRGGDEFPTLVRKTEPKPIRIFLEDGNTDLNIYAGDWWMANQSMLSALTWAGYEVTHVWGEEGHNSKGARKIMPEAMEWVWKDYPKRVSTHLDKYQGRDILLNDEDWKQIDSSADHIISGLTSDPNGDVYAIKQGQKAIYHLAENELTNYLNLDFEPGAICADAQELLVSYPAKNQILSINDKKEIRLVAEGIGTEEFIATDQGIYFSDKKNNSVVFYSFEKMEILELQLEHTPKSMALSAEKSFLNITTVNGVMGYSIRINDDGTLASHQPYIHYHIPYGEGLPGVQAIAVDRSNRTFTSTSMGIQMADQLGRINLIINTPGDKNNTLTLGGLEWNQLYLVSDGKLFKRKLNTMGTSASLPPFTPPAPKM